MHIAMRSAHYPVIKFCNCKFFRLFDTNRILSSIASEEWNQKTIAYTKSWISGFRSVVPSRMESNGQSKSL